MEKRTNPITGKKEFRKRGDSFWTTLEVSK